VEGSASHGSVTLNADGSFTFTPDKDVNGDAGFRFTASDGQANSQPATVAVTVKAVNDQPTAGNGSATLAEDGSVLIDPTALARDVETADPAALTYAITAGPSHGTLTPVSGRNGVFTYTPAADYNGSDSFTYTVTDTGDGSSAALTSAPATFDLTVTAVNDLPTVTAPASAMTPENADLVFHGITVADVDSDQVTVTLTADHGTLSLAG